MRVSFFARLAMLCVALPCYGGIYSDAVKQLGYSELAATFSAEKVTRITGIDAGKAEDFLEQQALAVLKTLGAPATKVDLANFVAHYNKPDLAYLGNLREPSVYQRIETHWLSTTKENHSDFANALRAVIEQGVATGYNIYTTPWPLFERETHIIYGHNDIDHAQQLLALLASEGLEAQVGFSQKTSAFLHRDDWGTPNPNTIRLSGNRHLIETREYDLHFGFSAADDKQRFMQIVNRYAKKNRAEQSGLIRSAWWQPYYRSLVAAPDFHPVTQILVSHEEETAVLLALPDKAPDLIKNITALNKTWTLNPETIWVNPAFYRYLQGGYK